MDFDQQSASDDGDDRSEDGELHIEEEERFVRRGPHTPPEPDDKDDDDSASSREDGTEDSLDIKPPQANLHHEKNVRREKERKDKHGHKSDSHRSKERHRTRDRVRRPERTIRDRRGRDDVRSMPRGLERRDARERIREREREKEMREREERESFRERQEWLERERRRERLMTAERERERQRELQRREIDFRRRLQEGVLLQDREKETKERDKKGNRSRSPRDKHKNRHEGIQEKTSSMGHKESPKDVENDNDELMLQTDEMDRFDDVPFQMQISDQEDESSEEEDKDSVNEISDHSASHHSDSESNSSISDHKSEKSKSDSVSDKASEDEDSEHEKLAEEMKKPVNNAVGENSHSEVEVESPVSSPVEAKPELPAYIPAIQGCRSVEEFHCLNRIEEGTYGVVYRARDKRTDEIVALKRLKMEKEKEGFPITSLREINTLLKAQHNNIVTVREIVVGSNMDKIYIVMDYVEHDLKSLMEVMKHPFLVGEVKTLMIQLLRAVTHLHDNWILHRDLKTSNLLLSHKGVLKVGDFGLAREYGSPLKQYTPVVVTLWYRAPELLLGCKLYSTQIDLWSVGCIFAEFLTMKPLFTGKSEIDQLNRIFKDLGSPSELIWPGYNELPLVKKVSFAHYQYNTLRGRFGQTLTNSGFELMTKFLTYNPQRRITAEEALQHEYFRESPLPVDPTMFPTWPAKSEMAHVRTTQSPKPPSGGKQYKQLGDADDELASGGFHMNIAHEGQAAKGAGFSLKF